MYVLIIKWFEMISYNTGTEWAKLQSKKYQGVFEIMNSQVLIQFLRNRKKNLILEFQISAYLYINQKNDAFR